MIYRILIDECLSPALAAIGQERGHDATHISYLGKAGLADWHIIPLLGASDFLFVTNNARDFLKLFEQLEVHNGLIVLIEQAEREDQIAMFEQALEVAESTDMINKLIEVRLGGEVSVRDWPSPES